jgi:PKD repeat protein
MLCHLKKHIVIFFLLAWGSIAINAQNLPSDFVHQSSINSDLNAPAKMAISSSGDVYVTDSYAGAIKKYDASGNYLQTLPYSGVPVSIAISDNNTQFIGDAENSKITRITPDGTQTLIYSSLVFPADMVAGPDNHLYVVDGISNKVLVLDFAGNLISSIGSGILLAPRCITFDRQNHRIIVSEHGGVGNGFNLHSEIRIFGLSGNLISTFGGYGNANGKFYRIQGMTMGRCGNIYVSDNFQGMISVFNANGVFITRFGQFGTLSGNLNAPMDIDFDANQHLWVSSMNNGALEVYSITDLLPSAVIPDISKTICPGGSANIPVSFTGTPPFSFTYTVNNLNPVTVSNTHSNPYIISATVPGSYNVTAFTDTASTATCLTGTTDVILNPAPTAAITNTVTSVCSGESVQIPVNFTGNWPYSFTYTLNAANPVSIDNIYSDTYTISASAPGTYTLASLSGGGCMGSNLSGSAVISLNQSPHAEISNLTTTVCAGQSTAIPVHFTGTPPWSLTYNIDNQNPEVVNNITDSNYLLNVSAAGNYQIVVLSDANCSSGTFSGAAMVAINSLPTATILSNNVSVCNGEATTIEIGFTGMAPWNFSLTRDGLDTLSYTDITTNTFSIPVSQSGTYGLLSVSSSDCMGTIVPSDIVISMIPKPTASCNVGDITVCAGEPALLPIFLTGSGPWNLTYTKNGANAVAVNNITTSPYLIEVSDSGFYEVTSLNDVLCTGSNFGSGVHVFIAALPTATITSGNSNVCFGQTASVMVNFTGTPPFSFEYTMNGSNPTTVDGINSSAYTLTVSEAGLYAITAVTGHACGSMNFSGSSLISVLPLPLVNLGVDADICQGSILTLDAGGPFTSYLWNNSGSGQTQAVNTGGAYSVSVTDSNGCTNHDSVMVTSHAAPIAGFGYSVNNFDVTFNNTSTNANTCLWDFGDGQTSNLPNPVHAYTAAGIYYVSLTVSNPYCSVVTSYDTINIQLTGMDDNIPESSMSIYPNPTTGISIIEINNPVMKYLDLKIFSMRGQLIYSDNFSAAFIKKSIDLSGFANGVYTVRLSSQHAVKTEKLILVK